MLTRIVKMHFRKEEIENFRALFESVKDRIKAFDGCHGVRLVQDLNNPEIFFTLSQWQTKNDLEKYRFSPLFEDTWKKTKAMFKEKAQAWSTHE